MPLDDDLFAWLIDVRVSAPDRIAEVLAARPRRPVAAPRGSLFLIAADHPARGALGVGEDALAMGDRRSLLDRLDVALEDPRVDGVLGSADVLEDLVLLGLLDDRVAIGTMNRGGLAGADWEIDDRFTAYDAEHLDRAGFEGGKMLLRLDPRDAGTVPTLEACARAVTELADRGLMAMVEPLPYTRARNGSAVYDDDHEGLVRAVTVAAGLGATSAYTWLKVPASADVEALLAATTLPALILGGPPGPDPAATFAGWERALAVPNCRGLVIGRSLLYPADGDVATAVAAAAALVEAAA